MNHPSLNGLPLLLVLLLLILPGCGPEKPGRQAATPAPVVQPPATPAKPEAPVGTPAEPSVKPSPPAPAKTAEPVTPPEPPPPSQPKTQKPAEPTLPPATSPVPVTAALGKAKVSKADNLFEKPFIDARVINKLKVGQEVDLLKREGAWYLLRTGGQQGWVRMLSIRSTAPAAVASSGSLSEIATGRAGTGQIVSTTGVRGLGEERLKEAPFSEAAIAAAERYRVKPADAERLARAQGLAPRQVPPLPAAAARSTEGGAP